MSETGDMEFTTIAGDALRRATVGFRDVRSLRATGYVFVSFFTLVVLFLVTLVMLTVALPLVLAGVGVPLVVATMALVERLIGVERRRAGWVGVAITRRPSSDGSLRAKFRDPVGWRNIGFAMLGWVVAAVFLAGLAVVWGGPLFLLSIPLWAWALDASVASMIVLPAFGLVLLCLSPFGARGVGWALRRFVEMQVGPDRIAEMEQQVSEISASRSDILEAVAGERRRIERNLHDGVQQRLVAAGIDLGLAQTKLDTDPEAARELLAEATRKTRESIGELRSIGRGLHPAILGDRGLDAALSAVVSNSSIPIELRSDLRTEPPAAVAEAAYFVVSEAVTNVMKHSKARLAVVDARASDIELRLSVYDDGRGGATVTGTGLTGIAARVRGLEGCFELDSPAGGPTVLAVTIPYPRHRCGGDERSHE